MTSTRSDRTHTTNAPDSRWHVDQSVFAAVASVPTPISVARFGRWFACFATAGREE